MKIILGLISILIIIVTIQLFFNVSYSKKLRREAIYNAQVGSFILDTTKTDLRIYKNQRKRYSNLIFTFSKDGKFHTNMEVPFLLDSFGMWEPSRGFDDWGKIYFHSNSGSHSVFGRCCLEDSTFYLKGPHPKPGRPFLDEVYFKKMPKK